jgi:hypothetical protein
MDSNKTKVEEAKTTVNIQEKSLSAWIRDKILLPKVRKILLLHKKI